MIVFCRLLILKKYIVTTQRMLVERQEESYERRFIFYPFPILTKTNKTLAVMQLLTINS